MHLVQIYKKNHKSFANSKKGYTFALALVTKHRLAPSQGASQGNGPFVYRLGRKIFILERGVRFPYGLQLKLKTFIKRWQTTNHHLRESDRQRRETFRTATSARTCVQQFVAFVQSLTRTRLWQSSLRFRRCLTEWLSVVLSTRTRLQTSSLVSAQESQS